MKSIKSIVCYPNLLPFEPTEPNVDAFMDVLVDAGVTHVQVNHLPDLMHPEQLNQPDNVYLWFANFGPPLDLYVSSKLNHGLWPETYLERNRRTLLRFAAAADRRGIKPVLYLCEPRFVPERFFQRHPTLRGSRVDNPGCSKTPLYSLCTDMPEVREHYREMMAKMMDLVGSLAMTTIFTSDSGAGFDYNPLSYAGANGPGFNRAIPLEQRVVGFLKVLLEEGRRKNPDFTVHLTSGFSEEMRAKILEIAPKGIIGSVYGLYNWTGGLEEHWGYHQALWGLPSAKWNVRNLDRKAAAADRFENMSQRFRAAAKADQEPIVHVELPSMDFPRPLRYTPHPFETIRLMKDVVRLGATKIAAWGVLSPKTLVPYDVNLEAMRQINEQIDANPETIVHEIAERWVGGHADALMEAWRKADRAVTHRPMWTHFGLLKYVWLCPLVPDLTALKPEEIAYYKTIGITDLEIIQGHGAWLPQEADEQNRDYVLRELYEKNTLPDLLNAVKVLDGEIARATGKESEALRRQRDHIQMAYLYERAHYNWYEAARYLAPGENLNPTASGRTMAQIIDDEITTTQALITLLDGRLEQFMRIYPSDFMTYEFGPGLLNQLKARISVMQSHRQDKCRILKARVPSVYTSS